MGVKTKKMVVDEGFTQKEMLIRIMDTLEKVDIKMNVTHELAIQTNGKVKLHTKLIFGCFGAIITLAGWGFYYLMRYVNIN